MVGAYRSLSTSAVSLSCLEIVLDCLGLFLKCSFLLVFEFVLGRITLLRDGNLLLDLTMLPM